MTAVQMNTLHAEILRNYAAISDSESLTDRLAKYLRRLVRERETDPTLMTKEEFFDMVEEREKSYENGDYTTLQAGESVVEMLRRTGYGI